MKTTVQAQNIKCGGCSNTISNKLERLHGIRSVVVAPQSNQVTIVHDTNAALNAALYKLNSLGYPLDPNTNSISKKVVSMFSCAMGRINN